ncbi:hypothetical protein KKC13_10040 [bacterium]|nr:hypothetical protein [bacterium]MBU1958343.1 hypothetical protein [bacterium]
MSLGIGFILKKVISFLLMPLTIGMVLALLGLWFLHKEKIKKAKHFLLMSFIWIALVTYAPVANLLLAPLENQYAKLEKIPNNIGSCISK